MSSGRLLQSFGPAEANERSPTVTRRDGRTSSWLEVADRRRRRDGKSATRRRRSDAVSIQFNYHSACVTAACEVAASIPLRQSYHAVTHCLPSSVCPCIADKRGIEDCVRAYTHTESTASRISRHFDVSVV